jgi:hypothetical protein
MKLAKKLFGIAVIITVIGFMVLPLTGCPEAGENDNKKNTPPPETPTIVYYTGDSIEGFAAWLATQPEGVLCEVKLTLNDLGGTSYTEGSLGSVIRNNPDIKVKLDLSDSTFTSIDNFTFTGCTNLTGITIPNSVTSIGENAFYSCTGLTSITIPNSVTNIEYQAFEVCTSLAGITVGEGNPNYASVDGILYDKDKTRIILIPVKITGNVTIPDGVTEIGLAFLNCDQLTSITVGEENLTFSSEDGILYNKAKTILIFAPNGITGNVTIPDSVIEIGAQAFYGCTGLTDITIPDSVTSIGLQAFYGCISLPGLEGGILYNKEKTVIIYVMSSEVTGNVTIPDGVTSIPYAAFYGCTSLTGITIPDSVTSNIVGATFGGCTSLTSVTIGSGVPSIENRAFEGSKSLTSVTIIGSGVTKIGDNAFNECSNLASVTIGSGVTGIGYWAFRECSNLASVTIGSGVTYIDQSAFNSCTSLTGVTIPNSVTIIGDSAFSSCIGLTDITIPNSVTRIGDKAFNNCWSLTSVTFATGSNIPDANFGNNVFPEGTGAGGNTLKIAYIAASPKEGTYTREANGSEWSKQN